MKNDNIVILGANGQLGSDLVKLCKENNLNHIAVNRMKFNALTDDIGEKLLKYTPKYIINCIATTNVDDCEVNSGIAFAINSDFAYRLAKFCLIYEIILIHISTDYVFDGIRVVPYTETDSGNPLNIYGLSKYTGDMAIQNYLNKYFIFRVSSLFGVSGASGKGGNFITTMKKLGQERDFVSVIEDQITCPTATLDVARCVVHFIAKQIDDYGVYNCVSSNSCSWFEFTKEIFRLANLPENKVRPIKFSEFPFKAKRPQYGVLSINKLAKYYQMPTWQISLQEYFNLECL